MRRRTRRSRFTWMPMLGSNFSADAGLTYNSNFIAGFVSPASSIAATTARSSQTAFQTALVPDFTQIHQPGSIAAGESLRDYTEGQDWFLRRLVGKLAIACSAFDTTLNQDAVWPRVLVTAGFFIGRAQEEAPGVPDYSAVEMDPQALDNIRQPWIWRRTWLLGAAQVGSTGTSAQLSATLPNSNEEFGSMADGPHIDAKTMRRIRRFERLWFTITAVGFESAGTITVTGEDDVQPSVDFVLDLRALGGMRKSNNRSIF